tara:strand:- start:509 stop:1207 length:699 start_codon:yes stop_codon:yes gene_type:complete
MKKMLMSGFAALSLMTFAACGSAEVDLSSVTQQNEALLTEVKSLSAKVASLESNVSELKSAFLINEDGSAQFASARPIQIVDYNTYGFSLKHPETVEFTATGLAGAEADNDSGSILASAGGTTLLLIWSSPDPALTPQESVAGAFQALQALTGASFQVLGGGSEGFKVSEQDGAYGSFVTRDAAGEVSGVGVIGGWVCPSSGRSFALTMTGADVDITQASFFSLLQGFSCKS